MAFNGTSSNGSGHTEVGTIVGAAVGGVVFLMLVIGGFVFWYRRRREPPPIGMYNRTDRIQRVKPATFPSDSVLVPLSPTLYPDTLRHEGTSSGTLNDMMIAPHSAGVPYHVRNFVANGTPSTISGTGSSALPPPSESSGLLSSSGVGSTQNSWPSRKQAEQHELLRSEVDNLRLEIERMKEERETLGMPPPSYDEEREMARVLRERSQRRRVG